MKIYKIGISVLLVFICFANDVYSQENSEINHVLSKKREYSKNNPTGKGYKIQLYNGNETRAYEIKQEYFEEFDKIADLSYEAPEWKVRIGNYLTRLEADRALQTIKLKFTGAIILMTEIKL
jgi:hypothetical protein|tara:strand:+ start:347 stop:712 length:366 start_codon:yes stop_codon:yes gene_type:complete